MAKWSSDTVLDGALNIVKNNVTRVTVCTTQPTTYTEATSTLMLAMRTGLTSGSFTGPVAGDTSGRKLTSNIQADITITNSGSAQHVALTSESVLLYITTCTTQSLTSGNTVTIPAWKIEIAAPS